MIASTMILTGSILILALAGYWMRRAVKAERRVTELQSEAITTVEFYEQKLAKAEVRRDAWRDALARLLRIQLLETPSIAHVGKKAVAIAKGEL